MPLVCHQLSQLSKDITGFRKMSQSVRQDQCLRIEDRGNKLAYITEDCSVYAGKPSGEPVCWLWIGILPEIAPWLTDKEFEIEQLKRRALVFLCARGRSTKNPRHNEAMNKPTTPPRKTRLWHGTS